MHPIERLRYVARASGADAGVLVRETAGSLGTFADDAAGMVMACRRMLARHLTVGPLWWMASRACCAVDPMREAWAAADEFDADHTARQLALALPEDATVLVLGWPETIAEALPSRGDLEVLVVDVHGEGRGIAQRLRRSQVDVVEVPVVGLGAAAATVDIVLLEASVAGPETFVGVAGSRAAAAVGRHGGAAVWLVAGTGRFMPERIWNVIETRFHLDGDEPWENKDELVPLDLVDSIVGSRGVVDAADVLSLIDCPIAPELFKEGVL